MNKTKLKMSLIIIMIVAMVGGATALIVNYLSNTVTADVTVNSPIQLKVGDAYNDLSTGSLSLGSIYGGETVEFFVSTENRASVSVTGTMWNIVSNPDGIACADFTTLKARVLDAGGNELYGFSDIGCTAVDSTSVRLITTPTEPWTWTAGHFDIADIVATFDGSAVGTYIVSTYVKA